MALNGKCHRLHGIALDRSLGKKLRLLRIGGPIERPALPNPQHMPIVAPSEGSGIIRLAGDCLIEQMFSALEYGPGGRMHAFLSAQQEVVRGVILGSLDPYPLQLSR